jgi:hypothetical protein
LVNQTLNGMRRRRFRASAKNLDFPAKSGDDGRPGRSTKRNSHQDAADLTHSELGRLNRFSNDWLHSAHHVRRPDANS